MKNKNRIFSLLTSMLFLVLFVTNCDSPTSSHEKELTTAELKFEGVNKYLPPMKGMSINYGNYYSYVYSTSDSTMEYNSGTYEVSNDTITNTVMYSNNEKMIGYKFKWKIDSINGDTVSITTFEMDGKVSGHFSSLKIK